MSCRIYIGTSGWQYGDWADDNFYPKGLREKDWLEFYSRHFQTVEVNSTFYHQMAVTTFTKWKNTVPENFLFSVKISRWLTHIKKLNDPEESWSKFIKNASHLRDKLGPILIQLPPRFKSNPIKLEKLFKIAGKKYRLALEVRDNSWFGEEIYKLLQKYQVSLVFSDMSEWLTPEIITTDFIYIRRHGPADRYSSNYSQKQLLALVNKIKKWQKLVKEIFVYFNNDTSGYAVKNALTLMKLVKA